MPWDAALSIARLAERRSAVAASPPSSDTAVRAFLAAVFSSVRTALFRSRRRSFWRFRLICDLILATGFLHSGTGSGTVHRDAYRLSGASYQAADSAKFGWPFTGLRDASTLHNAERWRTFMRTLARPDGSVPGSLVRRCQSHNGSRES